MKAQDPFLIEALVDFPDDAIKASEPITPSHIDAMMDRLSASGVRRVSWCVYADGRGGYFTPTHNKAYENLIRTYQVLGQNPLGIAVEAAHRYGMEIYAYYKPYETGPAIVYPEGSYEAKVYGRIRQIGGHVSWLDPFVVDHPHLRIKRRSDDQAPEYPIRPIETIKLYKCDALPTRMTREHLQIWVSDSNYCYQRLDTAFTLSDSIETCPRDIRDIFTGQFLIRRGESRRVITLSGFQLTAPYVLVTTDFAEGPADFANTDLEMLSVFDNEGEKIAGEIASDTTIYLGELLNFRNWGLVFDTGYNGGKKHLDFPGGNGRSGFVAFARGRNRYLPGALCETEQQVQDFWLHCIKSILATGVDGIDIREENHSTHTNHPQDYGYNEVVLEKCAERGRVNEQTIAAVRGDAYTAFLMKAKQLINSRGKRMRINFQIDWYRSDPAACRRLAYPANLDFQWQRWIREELADEAVLRFYILPFDCIFNDAVAQDLIERCHDKGIPITINRYIKPQTLIDEYQRVRQDGRFAGFILYETCSFLKMLSGGGCVISEPAVEKLFEIISTGND